MSVKSESMNVPATVTVANQAEADARIPAALASGPVHLRIEGMEGPITLTNYLRCPWCDGSGTIEEQHDYATEYLSCPCDGSRILSVTVSGGENPVHMSWIRKLRDDCASAGISFIFESWGEWEAMTDADSYAAYMADECEDDEIADMSRDVILLHPDGRTEEPKPTREWWTLAAEMIDRVGPDGDDLDFGEAPLAMHRVGRERSGRTLDGREWKGVAG